MKLDESSRQTAASARRRRIREGRGYAPSVTPAAASPSESREAELGRIAAALATISTADGVRGVVQAASAAVASLGVRFEEPFFRDELEALADTPGTGRGLRRTEIARALSLMAPAGGPLDAGGDWAYAFVLHGLSGPLGHLVASAADEPPKEERIRLELVASQASMAIVSLRSQSHEVAALEELHLLAARLRRAAALHQRLAGVALRGGGLPEVALALHEATAMTVTVEDWQGNLLALGGPAPARHDGSPIRSASGLAQSLAGRGVVRVDGRLAVGIEHAGEVAAALALFDPEGLAGDEEQTALEDAAVALEAELARVQSAFQAESRLAANLVEELVSGTDEAHAIVRARLLGYDLGPPQRVIVVGLDLSGATSQELDDEVLFHAVRRGARDAGIATLLSPRRDGVILVAEDGQGFERLAALVEEHLRGAVCTFGIGQVCLVPSDYPESYRQAMLALKLQSTVVSSRVTRFDELGVFQLLAEVRNPTTARAFIEQWLGSLIDYDVARRSDLVETLGQYLETGGNYDACAGVLAVHRSTLRYRLQRIREISGLDLADPGIRFNLQLATRARRTLRALGEMPDTAGAPGPAERRAG